MWDKVEPPLKRAALILGLVTGSLMFISNFVIPYWKIWVILVIFAPVCLNYYYWFKRRSFFAYWWSSLTDFLCSVYMLLSGLYFVNKYNVSDSDLLSGCLQLILSALFFGLCIIGLYEQRRRRDDRILLLSKINEAQLALLLGTLDYVKVLASNTAKQLDIDVSTINPIAEYEFMTKNITVLYDALKKTNENKFI